MDSTDRTHTAAKCFTLPGMHMMRPTRELLVNLAKEVQAKFDNPTIINIGIAAQYGCCSMACLREGAPDAELIGIDIERQGEIPDYLDPEKTTFVIMPSKIAAMAWHKGDPVHLLFVDGDHTYEGVLSDIHTWSGFVAVGGYMTFHDVNWKGHGFEHVRGVRRAVNEWWDSEDSDGWEFVCDAASSRTFRRIA